MDHNRRPDGDAAKPKRAPRLIDYPDDFPADTLTAIDHTGAARPVVEATPDGTLTPLRVEPNKPQRPPRKPRKPRARKPPKRAAPHVATCFACIEIATDAYRVEGELLPACHTHGLELLAGDHERVRIVRWHPRGMARASIGRFRLVKLTMAERAKRERIELAEAREAKRRASKPSD